jgi:predicted protein tyrosine phosphatase
MGSPIHLPFQITICGLDELALHNEARVSHVLSIMDPDWPVPEVFGTYGEHEKLELRFHDIIEDQPGMTPPLASHVDELLAFGRGLDREAGGHLLVHCHAGISRSSASMALLVAQALPAADPAVIFAELLRIRPKIWPNLRIIEMGDAALGRGGAMVAAVPRIYRHQIDLRPYLADLFRASGRGREVALALRKEGSSFSEEKEAKRL